MTFEIHLVALSVDALKNDLVNAAAEFGLVLQAAPAPEAPVSAPAPKPRAKKDTLAQGASAVQGGTPADQSPIAGEPVKTADEGNAQAGGAESAASPSAPTPASTPASSSADGATPSPSEAPAFDFAALRTRIKAFLAKNMTSVETQTKVTDLIQSFGTNAISKVPDDRLVELEAKAHDLFPS